MMSNQTEADSEEDVEIAVRVLSRGFIDLHQGVRAGEIVDPYSLPQTMGDGMRMLSRLCVKAGAEDLGDSIHSLTDTAPPLPVAEWLHPPLPAPARCAGDSSIWPTGWGRAMS